MPPYDNTPKATLNCACCGDSFATKRPNVARFCSAKCRNKSRPLRANTPADRARHAAWRRRMMEDPESRTRINEMQRARSRQIKDWLSAYKLEHGCVDCGYRSHPVALDVDHIDGKTANVSSLKSIKAILEEIRRHKCEVRCANCHRIKSWETKSWLNGQSIGEEVLAETYELVDAAPAGGAP